MLDSLKIKRIQTYSTTFKIPICKFLIATILFMLTWLMDKKANKTNHIHTIT